MRRGATSNQTFTLPFVIDPDKVLITYKQYGYRILEKEKKDLTITNDLEAETTTMVLTLSEKETMKFYPGYASVQVRMLLGAQSYASSIRSFSIDPVQDESVLSDA